MKNLVLVLMLVFPFCAMAQQQNAAAIAKAGVTRYQIMRANQSTRKPKLNEALDVHYRMTVGSTDSLLNETFTQRTVQLPVDHPSFKHVFLQLTKGDRVQIIVSADSFYKYTIRRPLPPYLRIGDSISFFIKVYDVLDAEGLMKKQMELDEEKAYIDSVRMQEYLNLFSDRVQLTPRGLHYVVTSKGKGPAPETGDSVTIKYRGYFADGRVFDKDEYGYSYLQGLGQVIPGLDDGVALMSEGAKYKLIIPYYLAYGTTGTSTVPGYTSLIFDVELVKIKRSP